MEIGSKRKTRRIWLIAAILGLVTSAAYVTRYVLVMANPVLIWTEVPDVRVRVDGKPISVGGQGYLLYPWRKSYIVEVDGKFGTARRKIFPWDAASASGAIFVDKNGVHFNLKSTELN